MSQAQEPLSADRLAHEAEHFDQVWRKRMDRDDIIVPPDDVLVTLDLGRSLAWVLDRIGPLDGLRVLELGSGVGDYTVLWARRGAQVVASDVSTESIDYIRRRADANGVGKRVDVRLMAAEEIDYPDASFDLVIGFGVIHHADVGRAAPEIRRVIKPGGRAMFREPLGCNPILEFVRSHVPYREKARSDDEHPLTYADLEAMGAPFRRTEIREFYLASMVSRAIGGEMTFPWLWSVDEWVLRTVPYSRRFARYVVSIHET